MALSLIFDVAQNILVEPGFHQNTSARDLFANSNASDSDSWKGVWLDPATRTLMLRPLQFDSTWLNTQQQLDSIIRLSEMSVGFLDTSNRRVFEEAVFGNNDNPYVRHTAAGPSLPTLGVSVPSGSTVATAADPTTRVSNDVFSFSSSVPDADSPPTPSLSGSTSSGTFVAAAVRQPANAAFFLRWHHPNSQLRFPCTYEFYIAQYRLRIKDVVVEVWEDTSAHGDRTAFDRKVISAPLFSVRDFSPAATQANFSSVECATDPAHDRGLLFLPFRRHQVLLLATTGHYAIITVRPKPKRNADNTDWDITRSDSIFVWLQTPAAGRFQIQKVKYSPYTVKVQVPPVVMDYTPAVSPTINLFKDSDNGTTLTSTRTTPPSYTYPTKTNDGCPPSIASANDRRKTYGIELSLTPSGDRRSTPAFYGLEFLSNRTFGAHPNTPQTVSDSGTGTRIVNATLTAGMGPGEGRLGVEIIDPTPYALSPFYYRSSYALQLKDGSTPIFTGIAEPGEVTVLKKITGHPRRITITALDRWKALANTGLRAQRDWTTYGHIDVVKFICEQGGIDCTSAEFPSGYTPNVVNGVNTALGGTEIGAPQLSRDVKAGWQPQFNDTAQSYIQRVADKFSGWLVGFRLDGTFFYLPRTYFTTPTVTFAEAHTGSSPYLYGNITFEAVEPEANCILVVAGSDADGGTRHSSLWVDWASVLNPLVVNYLGRFKREVISMGGAFTCAQLQWIARTVWNQTRRRKVKISFDADFVPSLGIGHVATVGSYGNYRITGFTVDLQKTTHHRAHYEGELVEKGYGL